MAIGSQRIAKFFVPLTCLAAISGTAGASGLQVTPTTLSLKASQNADGLVLDNNGDDVIHAQVRVYHWTQNQAGDQLEPSRGLVISPPMTEIATGAQQMIRVIRVGGPPTNAVEDAYRLSIDELPVAANGKPGLKFVVHYSVPIFIEPAGKAALLPQLQWSLQNDAGHASLQVSNRGNSHAQLAGIYFTDSAGKRTEIAAGLLGYVLPGSVMHWALKPPATVFTAGGTLEVMVNGQKTTENLSLAAEPR